MKKVLIISGPTGSGESTITKEIIKKFPIFTRLITATSREPRLNEKDRSDYYFFTKDQFEGKIKNGEIIEHTYIKNRDVYYGSYKPELEAKINKGYNIIANTDIIGTQFYKKNYMATSIFIKASLDEIRNRLEKRQPDILEDELNKRVKNAENEILKEEKFYDYIIHNKEGKLNEAVEEIISILKKEKYIFSK